MKKIKLSIAQVDADFHNKNSYPIELCIMLPSSKTKREQCIGYVRTDNQEFADRLMSLTDL